MRRLLLGLTFSVSLLAATGCPSFFNSRHKQPPISARVNSKPSPKALVAYLNRNAKRVPGLQCTNVTLQVSGSQSVTLPSAKLFCEAPRNLRMTAKILSSQGIDLGSNQNEFWYWISKSEYPDVVFHCSHDALANGKAQTPFPFRPEMVLNALGIAPYNPDGKYEVAIGPRGDTYELIEDDLTPQGQSIKKVTVFNARKAAPGEPQILAYLLRDAKGKEISRASVIQAQEVELPGGGVAVLPRRIEMSWPDQKVSMKLKLDGMKAVQYSPARSGAIFSRGNLSSLRAFDLATGQYSTTSGRVERAGHRTGGR